MHFYERKTAAGRLHGRVSTRGVVSYNRYCQFHFFYLQQYTGKTGNRSYEISERKI